MDGRVPRYKVIMQALLDKEIDQETFDLFATSLLNNVELGNYILNEYINGNITKDQLGIIVTIYRDKYYDDLSKKRYEDIDMRDVLIRKMKNEPIVDISKRRNFLFEKYFITKVLDEKGIYNSDIGEVLDIFIDEKNILGESRDYDSNIQSKSEEYLLNYSGKSQQWMKKEKVVRNFIRSNY